MIAEQMTQKTADTAAATSALLAGVTWIADLGALLQLGATLVAILAGAAAAWYHIERALMLRAQRKKDAEKQSIAANDGKTYSRPPSSDR